MALGTVNVRPEGTGGGSNVTADGETHLSLEEVFGPGPYEIEFDEDVGIESAKNISYDPATSKMTATDVQAAIDEMAKKATDLEEALDDVPSLGEDGKIPEEMLPELSASQVFRGILGTNWTEDENTGIKYQDVAIEGIAAEHNGSCDHDDTSIDGTSEGYALYVEEDNQWLTYITNGRHARTFDGYIRFEIFGDPNTVEIPFWVGVS